MITQLLRMLPMILLFSLTLSGCYYDKENELYPLGNNCDTAGVMTYTKSIAPIMSANCNVCHSGSNPGGGIITSTYDGLSPVAKGGQLWRAVNHEGSLPMPKGMDKLPACDLTKIKKWVDAGSLNN